MTNRNRRTIFIGLFLTSLIPAWGGERGNEAITPTGKEQAHAVVVVAQSRTPDAPIVGNNPIESESETRHETAEMKLRPRSTPAEWPDEQRISTNAGSWRTSAVSVKPFEYYRVRFQSKCDGNGYWRAVFFDKDDNEIPADHADSLFASNDWLAHDFCFRAHALAATARICFETQKHAISCKEVSLETVNRKPVAVWADEIAAANPPIRFKPAKNRWDYLPRTRQTLKRGGMLRVVILGDSIANDMANSAFEVLVEREHPGSRIEVISSTRGGTGCRFYQRPGRVEEYVLRFKPDLLIIAGISHQFVVEPIRSVIEQVRKESDCDILVLTGAVAPNDEVRKTFLKDSKLSKAEALGRMEEFPAQLRSMLDAEKVAFLDLRSVWDQYVGSSGKPVAWFLRDRIHANVRARQVMARILVRFFGNEK